MIVFVCINYLQQSAGEGNVNVCASKLAKRRQNRQLVNGVEQRVSVVEGVMCLYKLVHYIDSQSTVPISFSHISDTVDEKRNQAHQKTSK